MTFKDHLPTFKLVFITILATFTLVVSGNIDFIQLDQTQLICTSETNYAIALEQNGYIWKVVTINDDQITIVDAFCDEKTSKKTAIPNHELGVYSQLYNNFLALQNHDQLVRLGYGSKYFQRILYDNEANLVNSVEFNPKLRHLFGKTEIIAFKTPFTGIDQTKIIVNKSLIAIVNVNGFIRMKPVECLNLTRKRQLSHLIDVNKRHLSHRSIDSIDPIMVGEDGNDDKESSPSSPMYHVDHKHTDDLMDSTDFQSATETTFDNIFGLVQGDKELESPETTLQNLYDLVNSNGNYFIRSDYYQAKLMLESAHSDSSKCNQDRFNLWAAWLSNEDYMHPKTNLRPYLLYFAREQMLTCVETLNGSVELLRPPQILPQAELQLQNFVLELNKAVNEPVRSSEIDNDSSDEVSSNDQHLALFQYIPETALHKVLIKFIETGQQNVAAKMRRLPREGQKFVLLDFLENNLGQSCDLITSSLAKHLEFLQFLRSNQWDVIEIDVRNELGEGVLELLQITRVCQLINVRHIDGDRLLSAYEHRSGSSRNIP